MATIKLTINADNWLGTLNNERVDALDGDDILDGGFGRDVLFGNLGNDFLAGGGGNDVLSGGDGNDVLDGGEGNDALNGDAGDDLTYGGTGRDVLRGGEGNDYLFGGIDNDRLFGGAGSDGLEGGDGNDILYDGDNATNYGTVKEDVDELIGGAGNDNLFGGYDFIWGGEGNDRVTARNQATVYGGIGNDIISLINTDAALASWLDGGLGNDNITAGSGNDTLISGYGKDTLRGGAGNDTYVITFDNLYTDKGAPDAGADTIVDTAGTDTIFFIRDFSNDGRDDDQDAEGKQLDPVLKDNDFTVFMPTDIENAVLDDQVFVNNPDNVRYTIARLFGNTLNNNIKGSNLSDWIDGGAGNDSVMSGDGDDIIFTGVGLDIIDGGAGDDLVATSANFDLTSNGASVETVDLLDFLAAVSATGNDHDNTLIGNKFDNILDGGAGNDILDAQFTSPNYAPVTDSLKTTGEDTLIGGTGDDTFRVDSGDDVIIETATTGGTDTVEFKSTTVTASYVLPSGVENLKMDNLIQGNGNNLNNKITGSSAANVLNGGYGDDTLDGGTGIDTFVGGFGDDTFIVDNASETITENAGQGNDWVQSAGINLDLNTPAWGGSIENARLTGTTNLLNLRGSNANNYLVGNNGSNVLDGSGGIDTLEGGLGDDVYNIDSLTDKLVEVTNTFDNAGKIRVGWVDTIQSSVDFSLETLSNFENLSLASGSSAFSATGNTNANLIKGNELANTLSGLSGDDILDGAGGIDTLIGGKGNDTYRLSNDGDIITELPGSIEGRDTIEIQNTTSLASYSNVENLTLIGTLIADATGTEADNVLSGNSAANRLVGLGGNDTLIGGEGADTLAGGRGSDTIDLTESASSRDLVSIALGDSLASTAEADKLIKFGLTLDTLDLPTIQIATNVLAADGQDKAGFKSHTIANGIIRFDDVDAYASPVLINSTNLNGVLEYLDANFTNGETVAFAVGTDMWVFQDNGADDTLVNLVGTTASSLSASSFGSTIIHIA